MTNFLQEKKSKNKNKQRESVLEVDVFLQMRLAVTIYSYYVMIDCLPIACINRALYECV
jgi:hypothetical protein